MSHELIDAVPELVLVEIASWLTAKPDAKSFPTHSQLRDLFSLSSTCRRFRVACRSPDVWRNVEVSEVARGSAETAKRILKLPQVSACEQLNWTFGLSLRPFVDGIRSMPFLRDLGVALFNLGDGGRSPHVDVLGAIETLRFLVRLRIVIPSDTTSLHPVAFPSGLRHLELLAARLDVSVLFSLGPFPSIESLTFNGAGGGITAIVGACPSLSSLVLHTFSAVGVTQSDIDFIFGSCKSLTALSLRTASVGSSNFRRLDSSPFARYLRSFCAFALSTTAGFSQMISRVSPGLVELKLPRLPIQEDDVRTFCQLRHLESISVCFDPTAEFSNGKEMSEAFGALGNAEGCAPFKSLEFSFAGFDGISFFSARRCCSVRALVLRDCRFPVTSIQSLAENSRNSIHSLSFTGSDASFLPPLISLQSIGHLEVTTNLDSVLRTIGMSRPLGVPSTVCDVDVSSSDPGITDDGLLALAPAISDSVTHLQISCADVTSSGVISLANRCRVLRQLYISFLAVPSFSSVKKVKRKLHRDVDVRFF